MLLLPLGVAIALLPWRYALCGLMVFGMMSPAAVVNAGHYGLQPGYYLAMLLIARTAGDAAAGGIAFNAQVFREMKWLFWFIVISLGALFVALCFFQGDVETLPGSFGFKSGLVHPFRLSRENFTQLFYLLLNALLIYSFGHHGARENPRQMLRAWDLAVTCGLLFSVAVCVWQFLNLYAGVFFPADFFYSNAGYSRADSQSMAGLFRINGPFEEPSTLGYNLTGYLIFAWCRLALRPSALSMFMIAGSVFCLLVSTSTTAFLGLFMFGCLAVFDIARGNIRIGTHLSAGKLFAIGAIGLGAAAGAIAIAANWDAIWLILQNTLFQKSASTSFKQRSFADSLALQIFTETYGIGVGLGSHKANSLLLTILSNTGILGLVAISAFFYRRISCASSAALRPFKSMLLGLLAIHIFSNPNLSSLPLWLALGGILALQMSERGGHAELRAQRAEMERQPAQFRPNPVQAA